jgi:hypothetical protein
VVAAEGEATPSDCSLRMMAEPATPSAIPTKPRSEMARYGGGTGGGRDLGGRVGRNHRETTVTMAIGDHWGGKRIGKRRRRCGMTVCCYPEGPMGELLRGPLRVEAYIKLSAILLG